VKNAAVFYATLFSLFVTGCDRPPVNRDSSRPLATASSVDIARYTGRWYEIARFPNEFETDCVAVTATYSANDDRSLKVMNRCRKKTFDGAESLAEGRARIVDATTNAKLAVTFFWPFEGDYWILELASDYSWALVGEPSGRYLWILSRSPQISSTLRADLVKQIKDRGYNARALYWTPQP
jgi:apolipoprotein D and lipocalin family protein